MSEPRSESSIAQLEADLKVQRDALILASRQRELATRWAQRLAWLIEVHCYEGPNSMERVSEGGLLGAVRQATEAGFDPAVARERWLRGDAP